MSESHDAAFLVSERVQLALALGPQDKMSRLTFQANRKCLLVIRPILWLITPITSLVIKVLNILTLGLIVIPFTIPWMLMVGSLSVLSLLWVKVVYIRPLLIAPGLIMAMVAYIYAHLMPALDDPYGKFLKLGLADCWPYTHIMMSKTKSDDMAMTEENGLSSMCSSCNKEINTTDRFCQNCGAVNATYQQLPKKRISGSLNIVIATAIFVILLSAGQILTGAFVFGILNETYANGASGIFGLILGALGVIGWNKWNSFP